MIRFFLVPITFFATCLCSASTAGDESDDAVTKKEAAAKRFVGIELGPAILSHIQRNVRIADWNQEEIDSYYEVLRFARTTPMAAQKKQARANLLSDIETYRQEVIAAHRKQIDTKAASRRLKLQLRKIDEFSDDPTEYPLMARMVRSMIEDDPSRFHGKLVTLTGNIRRLISYKAHPNKFGITRLYEAWMFTKDSGLLRSKKKRKTGAGPDQSTSRSLGKIPVVIVFTEQSGLRIPT